MAMKHVDGDFFGPEHAQMHREFGFHGSTPANAHVHPGKSGVPYASDAPNRDRHRGAPEPGMGGSDYSHGGMVHHHPHGHEIVRSEHMPDGTVKHHHAHGGHSIEHHDGHMTHHHHDGSPAHAAHGGHMMGTAHPHGHHVVEVEQMSDGRIVHHHSHGGHTVHHADGRITHHMEDGSPAMSHGGHYAHGGAHHMPEGGRPHMAHFDEAEDKKLIKKAVHEHEDHEHHGEHTDLHLARGGRRPSLPRDMRPVAARRHSPIDTAPRDPMITTTPRNQMAGGQMGYGVEPSAEPDTAGDGQGIPQMRRGGHHKKPR